MLLYRMSFPLAVKHQLALVSPQGEEEELISPLFYLPVRSVNAQIIIPFVWD